MADLSPFRNLKLKIAVLSLLALAGSALAWQIHRTPRSTVDFSRDIRPILNQNCVACHGGVRQKNDVSFIYREEALGKGTSGKRTIIPGDPDHSELIARVTSTDPEDHMPYHGPMLSQQQIGLLRQWIKEGAKWDDYWAFVPPKSQSIPQVKHADWPRQTLDRFILARLEKEGLQPSPEADKSELLRRVSFDLTGLPPTPAEEAAYLADPSPDATEKQVERWAAMWLDLARYADTKGYEKDVERPGVWPYRDWVIDAFNANMPYDQFVIKQMAGDLLPNPTMQDRIATSFHRQTPNNDEGGTDDEEFRMAAVMDRVATTWSVMNGVTMNCVQCHSHPYDPIRHTDYYKTMAFFNTQDDADLPTDYPTLRVPKDKARYAEASRIEDESSSLLHTVETTDRDLEQKTQWKPLPIQAAAADQAPALESLIPDLKTRLTTLEADTKSTPAKKRDAIKDARKNLADTTARLAHAQHFGPVKAFTLKNGEAYANPDAPSQSLLEVTARATIPTVTAIRIQVPPIDAATARHTPENGFLVDKVEAWIIAPNGDKTLIPFAYFAQDSEANLEAALAIKVDPKKFPEDAALPPSAFAALPKLFETRWIIGVPTTPLQLPAGSRIQVALKQTKTIDDKPALVERVRLAVSSDPAWTTATPTRNQSIDRLQQLSKSLAAIPTVPVPVMQEHQPYEARPTLEFDRGNFLTKIGPNLRPDVPAIFPHLPPDAPRNRLTLARWFFMPGQPLTARVAVNRYWEELYGTGIVETLENFGSVGEEPSNQQLLDWLALHFQDDLHWDMKALLRELVTSATYRQSAATPPALLAKDPRNRLLARGPQQRLTAEMIRDQALVASGLFNPAMGGPPVMPPQPPGIWNSVYNNAKWTDATGPNRYRRAIYTFIKRTAGYPSALIFDASDRDVSLPRRIATNTPLQALVTFNDPVYTEAADALAQRVLKQTPETNPDATLDARLRFETLLVLSREPTPRELTVLRRAYREALVLSKPAGIMKASLDTSAPSTAKPGGREVDGLAAVASILFNLDSALVR
jgi:hypothetical protein